jgi:hypothetical protein
MYALGLAWLKYSRARQARGIERVPLEVVSRD